MKLKEGDKLLCKLSYDNQYYVFPQFNLGNYYTIENFEYDGVEGGLIFITGNNGKPTWFKEEYGFCLDDNPQMQPHKYIWKYFYTPQQVRKLKLKQLDDVKSR